MNPEMMHLLALERHQQFLKEAELERQLCCTPKPIKVRLPRLSLLPTSPAPCPTC